MHIKLNSPPAAQLGTFLREKNQQCCTSGQATKDEKEEEKKPSTQWNLTQYSLEFFGHVDQKIPFVAVAKVDKISWFHLTVDWQAF